MEWLCMTALKKIFAGNLPVFHGTCVCPLLDLKEEIFTKKGWIVPRGQSTLLINFNFISKIDSGNPIIPPQHTHHVWSWYYLMFLVFTSSRDFHQGKEWF